MFNSFSGGVDFSDVETIDLVITSTFPATDIQVDFVESTFVPVPEPSTAMLMGLGLVGLATRRRLA